MENIKEELSEIDKHVKSMMDDINAWLASENALFHMEQFTWHMPYDTDNAKFIDKVTVHLRPEWNNGVFLNKCKIEGINKKCWKHIESICKNYGMTHLKCSPGWCYECMLKTLDNKTYELYPSFY